MKTWDEIELDKRLLKERVQADPINRERFSGSGWIVFNPKRVSESARVIFGSNENGWEHVSVSFARRDPTWEEMCVAKDVFWRDDEECVQFHPKKSQYINISSHCLHIWRHKDGMDVPQNVR